MAWEENSRICLHMQLIAILSRIGVTIKGGFVDKKTEKRAFCYTVLLTNLKIRLSLSLSLFEVVKGP